MLCHSNACGLDFLTLIKRSPKLRSEPFSFLFLVCFSIIEQIPQNSPHAVTVPGAVSGWFELLSKHGKLNIEAVLAPARDLARNGFVVQNVCGGLWEMAEDYLKAQKATEHLKNRTR